MFCHEAALNLAGFPSLSEQQQRHTVLHQQTEILARIFRETPVKTRKTHSEYSRGGHSGLMNLRVSRGQGKRTTL